jgi:hypothetical protein
VALGSMHVITSFCELCWFTVDCQYQAQLAQALPLDAVCCNEVPCITLLPTCRHNAVGQYCHVDLLVFCQVPLCAALP